MIRSIAFIVLLCGSRLPAQQQSGGVGRPFRGVPDGYQIGASDVIAINIQGEREASVEAVAVRPDGKITMPLLHEIDIAGLTPPQAEKRIADGLSRFFVTVPEVTVIVSKTISKRIYVMGQVNRQGTLNYSEGLTVLKALGMAGGLTSKAKQKKVYVLRTEGGRQVRLPFDYLAVSGGTRLELDFPLIAGDTIVVP